MNGTETAPKPGEVEARESPPMPALATAAVTDVVGRKYAHCWLDPDFLAEIDDTTLGESD